MACHIITTYMIMTWVSDLQLSFITMKPFPMKIEKATSLACASQLAFSSSWNIGSVMIYPTSITTRGDNSICI